MLYGIGALLGGPLGDKMSPKKVLIAASVGVCISLISLLLFPVYIVGIALFIFLYGVFQLTPTGIDCANWFSVAS